MLEIIRGRSWSVPHTVYDTTDGPLSDLSGVVELKSQIRAKHASRDKDGHFTNELITDVAVTKSNLASTITLSLTKEATSALFEGDYIIDLVATLSDGTNETYIDPEPIRVVNHPTRL